MTQIAEQVGIHKSTVHRLLATLESKRFIQRDPETGIYRLGVRLLQMAYLTLEQNDLRRIATPFLRGLRDQFQETIHLAVLDDTDVVFVNIIESSQRVKLAASLGQRLPAFATASGKAMFAFMNSAEYPEQVRALNKSVYLTLANFDMFSLVLYYCQFVESVMYY